MHELMRIVPHPRTLRKAREQVKLMVLDGLSAQRIRNYLHRWVAWWAMTSNTWQYQELLQWFLNVCWQEQVTAYAVALYHLCISKSRMQTFSVLGVAA